MVSGGRLFFSTINCIFLPCVFDFFADCIVKSVFFYYLWPGSPFCRFLSLTFHGAEIFLLRAGQILQLSLLRCSGTMFRLRHELLSDVHLNRFLLGVPFNDKALLNLVFSEDAFYISFCFLEGGFSVVTVVFISR